MHFLRRQHLIGRDFPGVQDFALKRHDRLIFTIARLLGRAACRVPFDQEQFCFIQILRGAVRQFARQSRTAGELFTHHFFGCPHTSLGAGDRQLSQLLCDLDILVQPQAEGIFYHARDKGCALT